MPTAVQKLLDEHDRPVMNIPSGPSVSPKESGAGMLSSDQVRPSHRSANSASCPPPSKDLPTAMQALPDVHETETRSPVCAPGGKLGNGSSSQRTPFQLSATGANKNTVCTPSDAR